MSLENIAEDLRPLAIPIEDLQSDPANARTGHALDRIAHSLEIYGQRKPIVVNRAQQNKVEAGNGTLAAARKLGWTHIAVVFVEDDPATAAGYGIADNRTAELSKWDVATLAALADEYGSDEIYTGFEGSELEDLIHEWDLEHRVEGTGHAPPEVDRAADLREKWGTELGQLWQIGEHRLLCGDATSPEAAERIQDIHLAIMVTEQPDGPRADWRQAFALFQGEVVYAWHAGREVTAVQDALEAAGFEVRSQIIAPLYDPPSGPGRYQEQHASCWYAFRKGHSANWLGGRKQTTLWEEDRLNEYEGTARPIRNHAGDVYDPFVGFGTTLVASENLGRRCRAIDADPEAIAVTLERMSLAFPGIEIRLHQEELDD